MSISKDEKFRELLENTVKSFHFAENRRNGLDSRLQLTPHGEFIKKFGKDMRELHDYIDKYVADKIEIPEKWLEKFIDNYCQKQDEIKCKEGKK